MTRPSRSREIRAARHQVQAMKRASIEFPDEAIAWHLETLLSDDSPFPLPNGTQADPRQAWVLPSNEQEK